MSHDDLHGLSPADIAILFEPNPYSYDSAVTDPSLPPSPFVQVMREQEERFYAVFPEARTAAESRKRRKAELLSFLASRRANSPLRREYSGLSPFDSPIQPYYPNYIAPDPILVQSPTHVLDSPALFQIDQDADSTYSPLPQEAQQPLWEQPAPPPSPPTKPAPSTRTDRPDRPSRSRPSSPTPSHRLNKKNSNSSSPNGLAWGSTNKRRPPATTTRTSPPPAKRQQADRKPTLACLFCRGRKIACGAPLPGSVDKTCNQCQRRSLRCEFPAESRRGMRKRKGAKGSNQGLDNQSLPGESILLP